MHSYTTRVHTFAPGVCCANNSRGFPLIEATCAGERKGNFPWWAGNLLLMAEFLPGIGFFPRRGISCLAIDTTVGNYSQLDGRETTSRHSILSFSSFSFYRYSVNIIVRIFKIDEVATRLVS